MGKLWIAAGLLAIAGATSVEAALHSIRAFDGAWHLTFATRAGACDPNYEFDVTISDGVISHPNLVKLRGRVTTNGTVRASVTVQDKHASGAGRLNQTSGSGSWSGFSGSARCSGVWTARKV
jgi:hypothetical protein